jgi:hypothetical protein
MFRPYIARKYGIVNLKNNKTFKGFIYRVVGPYLVLRQAELINQKDPGQPASPVDGEVVVLLADVDFIQIPG